MKKKFSLNVLAETTSKALCFACMCTVAVLSRRECYQQLRNIAKAGPLFSPPSKFHVNKLVKDQFARQCVPCVRAALTPGAPHSPHCFCAGGRRDEWLSPGPGVFGGVAARFLSTHRKFLFSFFILSYLLCYSTAYRC